MMEPEKEDEPPYKGILLFLVLLLVFFSQQNLRIQTIMARDMTKRAEPATAPRTGRLDQRTEFLAKVAKVLWHWRAWKKAGVKRSQGTVKGGYGDLQG